MNKTARQCWRIAALLLIASESLAQSCPQQIRGGWESELASKALFEISLAVSRSDSGDYSAVLGSAGGEEDLTVWCRFG